MQTYNTKIYYLFLLIFATCFITKASGLKKLQEADSLYKSKSYVLALIKYEEALTDDSVQVNPAVFLKIANISEKYNDIPKTLYFLSRYNDILPSKMVDSKLKLLAKKNNNTGYVQNEIDSVVTTLTQYYNYVILTFLLVGVFLFSVLFSKFIKKAPFLKRHTFVLVIYFSLLLLLTNIPSSLSSLIVKDKIINLKESASGVSKNIGTLNAGDKINFYGQVDIWCRIIKDGKTAYVNETECWKLN